MLNVLLTTAMFVGGSVAFILDNTIPGKVFNPFFFTFLKKKKKKSLWLHDIDVDIFFSPQVRLKNEASGS